MNLKSSYKKNAAKTLQKTVLAAKKYIFSGRLLPVVIFALFLIVMTVCRTGLFVT
jgi:hypothetical protein